MSRLVSEMIDLGQGSGLVDCSGIESQCYSALLT